MVKVYVVYESKLGLRGSFFGSKKRFKEDWSFYRKYWKWCIVRMNIDDKWFWESGKGWRKIKG